jgi:hypothetical protein
MISNFLYSKEDTMKASAALSNSYNIKKEQVCSERNRWVVDAPPASRKAPCVGHSGRIMTTGLSITRAWALEINMYRRWVRLMIGLGSAFELKAIEYLSDNSIDFLRYPSL